MFLSEVIFNELLFAIEKKEKATKTFKQIDVIPTMLHDF